MRVYEIKNKHRAQLVDGFEAPLYINGKPTGDKVRVMPILEDE